MTRIGMSLLAAAVGLGAAWPAEAFWVARDWRGIAVGGIRAPLVAREAFVGRCWRCAPFLAAAPALAAAAVGTGAAVAAAPAPAAAPAAVPAAPAPAAGAAGKPAAPTQVAQANSASTHCAAGLPADSKMIYDASIRNMKSLETLRDTVVAETRSLVEAGRLSEAEARPAAEKAGTCLRLLAHP
ncbi:hypothetical protein VQ03_28200 [Methylobacterium tarhaniae]|uniref:Uncharacterized protein n=1 Tax=Methylobacterium tarhaniae TaxID=1187852 RepID=A0A0J6UWT2_9HYPH|nr:hypothetical protein [Methylobacterium tarhaniae]KMO30751.1 hypothetical protein VQ03_28200 [Methylobacterium tarhaniae]